MLLRAAQPVYLSMPVERLAVRSGGSVEVEDRYDELSDPLYLHNVVKQVLLCSSVQQRYLNDDLPGSL